MHHLAEKVGARDRPLALQIDAAIADLHRQVNQRDHMLRQKDAAMQILFDRLRDAGVDFSDLIP